MNIRALLPVALLCSALALSACGNKGPLLPPPAPEDGEWPVDAEDSGEVDEADGVDALEDGTAEDAASGADPDADADEADVDGEGDDPEKDPVPADGGDGVA